MKEEAGNMLGLSPGLRDTHPFPAILPGFPRGLPGLPGLPPTNGSGLNLPLGGHGNGPPSPAIPNMWPFIWSHISNLLPQLSISRMDPLSQVFSLRWNHHQSNMFSVFERLLHTEAFADVTLACDGGSLKCHKIVLAASSDYFQKLFMDNSSEHPIVFLKDVKASQVRAILDYMYKGEVSVAQDELPSLLRVAEMLKIKGMTEESAKNGGERRDSHLPRSSSPNASIPPNSIVPPNGDLTTSSASSLSMPNPSKTPTSIPPPPGAIPPNFRPFLTPPGGSSTPPFPMWPLPGLFPGAHNLFGRHDERKDLSPGPRDRSKMSSGSSSDKEVPLPPLIPRDNVEDGKSKPGYEKDSEYNDKSPHGSYNSSGDKVDGGIAGYVPAQRLEWKRYKQYTRNDIMQAIEEVRKGKSALQVSKKFNIPSRTLYDKVKKMGITTGRQQQRKSMNNSNFNYSAAFPGLNMLSPMSHMPENMGPGHLSGDNPYKSLIERMKDNRDDEDSRDTRDSDLDKTPVSERKDLGPMPFSILPPHMLNMMERIKAEDKEKMMKEDMDDRDDIASSPMNLSSERDTDKRTSETSFPHSPSPGSTDLTTSPSNCQNSPPGGSSGDYNGARDRSPDNAGGQQIDIRAQFLAGLRTLGDRRGAGSPELIAGRSSQDSLPPRKRKVSHEHDSETSSGAKLNLQDRPGPGINGLCESDSAVVN